MLLRKSLSRALTRSTIVAFQTSRPHPRPIQFKPAYSTTPAIHHSSPMAARTDTDAAASASSTGVTADSLSATLKQKLDAIHVEIEDLSGGCGQAFGALIVSSQFDKKTLLARHRLVNSALKEEIAAIHAWTPRCLTPEQWEKEKAKLNGTS